MTNNINWFPGHMAKAIRQIDEKIKLIDLVIEVVDCRIPFSSANPVVAKLSHNKPRLIILNKKDLADPKITEMWLNYYQEQQIPVIMVDSKHHKISKIIVSKILDILKYKLARDYKKGIKNPQLKVMILGIPNVGKSTVINSLINKASAKVGNKPGVTKGQQWLKLNDQIALLDTPGILWPNIDDPQVALHLVFTRSIKEEILPKEEICLAAIKWIYEHYFNVLVSNYQIPNDYKITTDTPSAWFDLLLLMQKNRFQIVNADNVDNIVQDFLNKLWNNEFGLLSFETPREDTR